MKPFNNQSDKRYIINKYFGPEVNDERERINKFKGTTSGNQKFKRNKEFLIQKSKDIIKGRNQNYDTIHDEFHPTFSDDVKDSSNDYYSQYNDGQNMNFRTLPNDHSLLNRVSLESDYTDLEQIASKTNFRQTNPKMIKARKSHESEGFERDNS